MPCAGAADERETGCPSPRHDRAFEVVDLATGELRLVRIPCGRNGCAYCRRRNVQVTAAKIALSAERSDLPPTYAVLSTTRDWVPDSKLREGWAQFARRVRREVCPHARYFWFREWTEGRRDGIRRTHYHSGWCGLDHDDQAAAVAEISHDVWGRITAATSEKAHGWQPIWDAGGLGRYVAGLVGHHLKANQAPPPGWTGRRYGVSRGFYPGDSRELDREAKALVRDERLLHHLSQELGDVDELPDDIRDELLTVRLAEARARPKPKVVRLPPGWTW
jgi:hypothetical protein